MKNYDEDLRLLSLNKLFLINKTMENKDLIFSMSL